MNITLMYKEQITCTCAQVGSAQVGRAQKICAQKIVRKFFCASGCTPKYLRTYVEGFSQEKKF